MIKASALLVVVAIGLLVAGVLASSLLMVYVSIGVCAVAALLLAVGVFSHWSEIFGQREARPASRQGVWSEPQVHVTGPVLASLQAVAAARGSGRPGSGEADVRPGGERSGGERWHDHPAEVDQPQAEVGGRIDELRAAGRNDDLWERVEEELGSAAKRDTGALSWPGMAFPPVPPDLPVPSEPAAPATETGPQGEPRVGASAWIRDSGAGWQPPESPEGAWPPPAAAFAEPQASTEQASPEAAGNEAAQSDAAESDAAKTDAAESDAAKAKAAGSASAGARRTAWDSPRKPVPETVTDPAPDAEPAPLSPDSETAGPTPKAAPEKPAGQEAASEDAAAEKPAPDDPAADEPAADKPAVEDRADQERADPERASDAADDEEPAAQGGRPQEIIPASAVQDPSVPSAAATDAVVTESAMSESPAEDAEADGTGGQDPQAQDSASEDSDLQDSEAQDSKAEDAGAGRPAADGPAAPEPPAADEPAARPPAGQVEVTVVPGVARYHRSECILIRFLGAGDLEIMTRQEAEEAKFAACRACQPDQLEA